MLFRALLVGWVLAATGWGAISPEELQLAKLFHPKSVRMELAYGRDSVNSMGDWYDFDGGHLSKSDLQILSTVYVRDGLIDAHVALAGLRSNETYIRVTCKLALEKILQREIHVPYLLDPDSPQAKGAYARVESMVRANELNPKSSKTTKAAR